MMHRVHLAATHDSDNLFLRSTRFNYLLIACSVFYAIFLIPR